VNSFDASGLQVYTFPDAVSNRVYNAAETDELGVFSAPQCLLHVSSN